MSSKFFEPLETRSLLSATLVSSPVSAADGADVTPPTVVKEQLLGPDPRHVAGILFTFSEALDPTTAQDLKNFRVGTRTDHHQHHVNDVHDNHESHDGQINFDSA